MRVKQIILITITIAIYFCLLFLISDFSDTEYLFIDYNTKWKIRNDKWSNIESFKGFEYQEFSIYLNKVYEDQYLLNYKNNIWELYNKDRLLVEKYGEVLAYRGKKEFELITDDIEKLDDNDRNMLKDVLKSININNYTNLITQQKMKMDLDNDRNDEVVVVASNFDYDTLHGDTAFSIAYVVDDGLYDVLVYDTSLNQPESKVKLYFIYGFVRIGTTGNYKVLISQNTYGEYIPYCHYAFDITKKQNTLVTSCKNEVEE